MIFDEFERKLKDEYEKDFQKQIDEQPNEYERDFMEKARVKSKICEVGRRLWQLGFVAGNDGNISVKFDEKSVIATPSGVSKADMTPYNNTNINEIVEIYADEKYDPEKYLVRPSSEIKMHLRCYSVRPEVKAVIHAHPPFATAFACAGIPLNNNSLSEAVMQLGEVPVVPYATPGSDDVPEGITPFIKEHNAILLANHGAVTVGKTLTQAYYRMETLEQVAKITFLTKLLGGGIDLPEDKLAELRAIGLKMANYNSFEII